MLGQIRDIDRRHFPANWQPLLGAGGSARQILGYIDTNSRPGGSTGAPAVGFTTTSDARPLRAAANSTLHVALSELPVQSHEGGRADYSKTICVVSRQQVERETDDELGASVYTANYQDWIDVNNADELHLQQLTTRIRDDTGAMAADLSPESSLVLKFRADPSKRHEAAEQKRHDRLMEALAARTNTAVPLQPTIAQSGS